MLCWSISIISIWIKDLPKSWKTSSRGRWRGGPWNIVSSYSYAFRMYLEAQGDVDEITILFKIRRIRNKKVPIQEQKRLKTNREKYMENVNNSNLL